MFPGVADTQVTEYIDYMASFSEGTLTVILTVLMYLQKVSRPLIAFYGTVDAWTYGNAKHIALLFAGVFAYIGIIIALTMFKFFYKHARVIALFLYSLVSGKSATQGSQGYGAGISSATSSSSGAGDVIDHAGVTISSSIPASGVGDHSGKDDFDI